MNSYLIVHHPYRTLTELMTSVFGMSSEECNTASQVVNDTCVTDLPLIYPPHILALTAIFLTVALKPSLSQTSALAAGSSIGSGNALTSGAQFSVSGGQLKINNMVNWFAESKVDMEAIIDCTQEIISLYEVWESYMSTEKVCRDQLAKLVKTRGL